MEVKYFGDTATVYGCIYVYRNKINGKCYVGQTTNPDQRKRGHLSCAKNGSDYHFHRALRKYGIENFYYFEVFGQYMPIELVQLNLDYQEQYYIKYYNSFKNGYNSTIGGYSGGCLSEESKQKIHNSKLGHSVPNETRQKISETLKNQKQSEETKNKRRNSILSLKLKWIHLDNETKRVKSEELNDYLNNGWKLGRIYSRKKLVIKND